MIEHLSEEMQGLFNLAAEISAQMEHYYLGVEHLFLACIRVDRDSLTAALEAGGVSLDKVVQQLLEAMAQSPTLATGGRVLVPPRLAQLLDAARDKGQVQLAALLPLIMREGRSLPCHIIRKMGGNLAAIADYLQESPLIQSAGVQEKLAQARTPALSALGRDVTRMAAEGKIDPVTGRDREIIQVAQVLARKTKNNPVLLGDAGVGKTAVVEGLALRIAAGQVPPNLRDRRIIELPLSVLVAGTQYRGQFEERLNRVVEEAQRNPEIILFIDELHTLVGAGSGGGTLDAANILKPALARGDLRCIGATTVAEYHRHVEPDAALERRFSPVLVRELSPAATMTVLESRRPGYEAHHGVQITDEALAAAVRLSVRHVPERRLPDKALDLLDEACSRLSILQYIAAGADGPVEVSPAAVTQVTAADVANVLADRTGLPLDQILLDETSSLVHLEAALAPAAVGQDEALAQVAATLRRLRAAADGTARPASFIFAGPAGSGRHALAAALSEALFHKDAVITFDLGEYTDRIDVEKLLGAPPGYIGHDQESLLSRRLRRDPYVLVVIERMERAHAEVQDVFRRGLLEGRIGDNQGHTVHLENAVVVMMVELDVEGARRAIGFHTRSAEGTALGEQLQAQVRQVLGEETVAAAHQIVPFRLLDEGALSTLAQAGLERLANRAGPIILDESIAPWLAAQAVQSGTGRQALERLLRDQVAGPVYEALKNTPPGSGEALFVEFVDGALRCQVVRRPD